MVCILVGFYNWLQFIRNDSRPVWWWNRAYCLFTDKNGIIYVIH